MSYALAGPKTQVTNLKQLRLRRRGKKPPGGWGKAKHKKRSNNSFQRTKSFLEWIAKLVVLGACCYALFAGFIFLTTSPEFVVSKVTITGNKKFKERELLDWIGPVSGKNIFLLDLGDIRRKLDSHLWFHETSVQRAFPQHIRIKTVERTPYARIQLDQIYVMDNFGVLLGSNDPAYRHLPLFIQPQNKKMKLGQNTAEEDVIQSMKSMHYFNRLPFFRKDPIYKTELGADSRITFITRNKGLKIFMSLDSLPESFKNFTTLIETIEAEGKKIEHLDLSFKDQIVVKFK